MAKIPESSDEIVLVMKEYILKKKFTFSDAQIEYMAEDCYLFFSGRDWAGVKYWPSVAMRWVLNSVTKFGQEPVHKVVETKSDEPTLRDKLLKEQKEDSQTSGYFKLIHPPKNNQ